MLSTKVHKLLFHVIVAIKAHGNIHSGNTGANKSGHKDEKPYYTRTNKVIDSFTWQLVRHAHGARALRKQNADDEVECRAAHAKKLAEEPAKRAANGMAPDGTHAGGATGTVMNCSTAAAAPSSAASGAAETVPAERRAGAAGGGTAAGTVEGVTSRRGAGSGTAGGMPPDGTKAGYEANLGGAGAAAAAGTGCAASGAPETVTARSAAGTGNPPYHRCNMRIGDLAKQPGLGDVGVFLGLVDDDEVRVMKRLDIDARFECGGVRNQRIHATEDDRGSPWYDHVFFHPPGQHDGRRLGKVRANVRRGDEDHAIVCLLKPLAKDQ
eukprot:TRINITY_DN2030_c0_g1_i1.p2 TRINITY_DN2030_c0_g1~~TRINITY_DN2030_c0_g1_i1.p2  ORF type:complete len:324 (+),score=43.59 TRINITY_DN2030_c0_g1_i1:910-1881(+)